jgi:hypothetical protein
VSFERIVSTPALVSVATTSIVGLRCSASRAQINSLARGAAAALDCVVLVAAGATGVCFVHAGKMSAATHTVANVSLALASVPN